MTRSSPRSPVCPTSGPARRRRAPGWLLAAAALLVGAVGCGLERPHPRARVADGSAAPDAVTGGERRAEAGGGANDDGGPRPADDGGLSCAQYGALNGFAAPVCELDGDDRCAGLGAPTIDCDRCCDAPVRVSCVVNGHPVPEPACGWLHYIGRRVVPRLAGDRATRIRRAALVAWWSLKEGVLSLPGALSYSNCNSASGDQHIGPTAVCGAGRPWQVGIAASQVPWPRIADLEAEARARYPEIGSVGEVLRRVAQEAGLDSATVQAIVSSTGYLRESWLLRIPAVGVSNEWAVVADECVAGADSWCFGGGWDESRWYAPTKSAALGAMADLEQLFALLAP